MAMSYAPQQGNGGVTHYLSIDGNDSALFIPDRFHTTPGVDLILYFHGHQDAYTNIRDYINRPNTSPLRDAVADDGRFALAMPYLKTRSNARHIVASTQAFDAYVAAILDHIFSNASVSPDFIGPPQYLRRLVIAAHSGGGEALSASIILSSSFMDRVVAAWAFDCFYTNYNARWVNWAKSHPDASLWIYHTPGDGRIRTDKNSEAIKKDCGGCTNVHSTPARDHDLIPKKYFPDLLKAIP